ncbi:MAG: hypothetical protein QMD50_00300 [Patescibacteria group bacterium]|nr:hypothetical protein [Patescibacteria group bacterium]
MDIFSHALWGTTIIRKRPFVWWAFLFGAAPDILGTGPGILYTLFKQKQFLPPNFWQLMPQFAKENYHFWHSILGILVVFLLLFFIKRGVYILTIPYIFHVFIDILTHQTDIFSRLFYPLVKYSEARSFGLNWWENSWLIWLSLILIIVINSIIFIINKKRAVVQR